MADPFADIPIGNKSSDPFADIPVEAAPKADRRGSVGGAMRRMQEPGVTAPAMPQAYSPKELGEQYKQGAIGFGAAIPGTVGDIESLGRFVGGKVGLPLEKESFFPTSATIATTFAGEPGSKEESEARKIGMFAGGLFGPSALAKGLRLTGESALIGRPGLRAADIAKQAEKDGFTVSAPQVRQAEPKGVPLNAADQQKMNRLVSKETGESTNSISPEFITKRREALGKDYDRLYKNDFNIDANVASSANNIALFLDSVNPAGSAKVKNIAENIVNRIDPKTSKGTISGKELKALRTSANDVAFTSENGTARIEARKLVHQIDEAIENTNPAIAKELKETNRKYWATMTLQDLRLSNDASIMAGNISPQKLGGVLEKDGGLKSHPLKRFGDYGTALKMRSITEGAQGETDILRSALSLGGKAARALTPIAAPAADFARRAVQKRMTPGVVKTPVIMPKTAAAAEAGRIVTEEPQNQ